MGLVAWPVRQGEGKEESQYFDLDTIYCYICKKNQNQNKQTRTTTKPKHNTEQNEKPKKQSKTPIFFPSDSDKKIGR